VSEEAELEGDGSSATKKAAHALNRRIAHELAPGDVVYLNWDHYISDPDFKCIAGDTPLTFLAKVPGAPPEEKKGFWQHLNEDVLFPAGSDPPPPTHGYLFKDAHGNTLTMWSSMEWRREK
jgi:hypothetical protein